MKKLALITAAILTAAGASAQKKARALAADFEAMTTEGSVPLDVQFIDRSVGGITKWKWEFGDGETSNASDPMHTYRSSGVYTVSLTVRGQGAANTMTRTDLITVDPLPPGFVDELVIPFLNQVTGFIVMGENDIVLWEKQGRVRRWIDGSFCPTNLADIKEEVANWSDHGLHGFAFDPHYDSNGYVYLYYAVDRHYLDNFGTPSYDPLANEFDVPTIARITRYMVFDPADPATTIDPSTRLILVGEDEFSGIPICAASHGIGWLAFGHDENLFFSCGDSWLGPSFQEECATLGYFTPKEEIDSFRAQLPDSPNGKIHRIDPATGDGVFDNPLFSAMAPRSWASRMWAMGLRNPYRFSFRPDGLTERVAHGDPGVIYVGDVGAADWEELSVVTEGGQNFGWPLYEGMEVNTVWQGQLHENLDAPNPLFGTGGCTDEYFLFHDLLVQDSLNPPSWPNPCDAGQQIPPSIPLFVHRRPALTWIQDDVSPTPVTRIPDYDMSGNAIFHGIEDPGAPVGGFPFHGSSSIGGTWYSGLTFPEPFRDVYFHAEFVQGWMKAFEFDANEELVAIHDFSDATGSVTQITTDPDESALYYLSYRSPASIRKISYGANAAPTASAVATPFYGPAPLRAELSAAASSDPEEAPLVYQWDFADGEPFSPVSTWPDTVHVYPSEDVTHLGQTLQPLVSLKRPRLRGETPLSAAPVPTPDLPLVHDGIYGEVGSSDPALQSTIVGHEPWIGYLLSEERELVALIFQEGVNEAVRHNAIQSPVVEAWDATGSVWTPVQNATVTVQQPMDADLGYETLHVDFDPVATTAIRLRDEEAPGGVQRLTVAELRVIALPTALPTAPASQVATVEVTDPFGEMDTASALVSINNTPPGVTLLSPLDGSIYPVGVSTMVPLSPSLVDAEHAVGTLACEWAVDLIHEDHSHPQPLISVCDTTFTLVPHGELLGDTVYWTFTLTVTDPEGLSTTVQADVIPEGDCNLNGILDADDITAGTSLDTNMNGIPDECEGP